MKNIYKDGSCRYYYNRLQQGKRNKRLQLRAKYGLSAFKHYHRFDYTKKQYISLDTPIYLSSSRISSSKYWKRFGNRRVRHTVEQYNNSTYRKIFNYWQIIT